MSGSSPAIRLRPVPGACPYLPGPIASFEHFLWNADDAETLSLLLESGFRHFGDYFFRPACPGMPGEGWCGRCIPLRVDVAAFRPSRSQRRVLRRGAGIDLQIGPPEFSEEKYALYRRHKGRFAGPIDGPENESDSIAAFRRSFYAKSAFTRECVWRLDGAVVAVSFLDLTPRAASSIYCFFDPDHARLSPGTLSILREIEIAREASIPYYYLGYWIGENRSMRYKMDFCPNEIFDGAAWRPCRDREGEHLSDAAALRTAPFRIHCAGETAPGP